jgi:hypothetical protein
MDTQRIVEVTGHKGKRSERKFKPSWLLVYVGIGQQDTVCAILIDGAISDPHHQFVNQIDFLTVLGVEVEPLVEAPSALEALRDLELANSPRVNELIEIAREIPFDDDAQEVELSGEDEGELRISPASANFRRVGVGMFLNETQSPSLVSVYEHGKLLQEALTCASTRLLIVSPWIKANVVDKKFIENIERLLKREVDVTIVYGYEDGDGNHSSAINALCDLVPLGLKFLRHENTHAKVLVVDNCAIMTSFNWLSFKGDPARTYRMEEGMEYRSEQWCNVLLETLNDKFSREASPASR